MQFINTRYKYFILTILSCCLLVAWFGKNNIEISNLISPQIVMSSQNESIWSSISNELQLDHQADSSRVQAEIKKLLADQDKFYQILEAAAPYIYFIHSQAQKRGLPAEVALIPVIESEFNPNDHSKKGATGLWQLMPRTATELGIKVKASYDGRRNVISSTTAALAYLNDLGNMFKGNWYLALAAYNCGQMRVLSTQKRTGIKSFWSLPLPQETKYYVPKLLAVAAIIKNPKKYGVVLPDVVNKPYFTELKIKKSINLQNVSKTSGVSLQTLTTLNPDYKKGSLSPKVHDSLLVPANVAAKVKAQLQDAVLI